MWRINAVRYYEILAGFLIILEFAMLIGLASLMILFDASLVSYQLILRFLITAIIVSIVVILNILFYILIYHYASDVTSDKYTDDYHTWLKTWTIAHFTGELPDSIPLKRPVMNAYRDYIATNRVSDTVLGWAKQYHMLDRWQKDIYSRHLTQKIEAIEALGILGKSSDARLLLNTVSSRDLEVNIAYALAIARILSRQELKVVSQTVEEFGEKLVQLDLPVFVVEDVYDKIDLHAGVLQSWVLEQDQVPNRLLLGTINAIGNNFSAQNLNPVADFLYDGTPMFKVAILKLFLKLKYIPEHLFREVLLATGDENDSVREQALLTLETIPLYRTRLPLWLALGDDNWTVRHVAATVLTYYGDDGYTILQSALEKHEHDQAKVVAKQVLSSRQPL